MSFNPLFISSHTHNIPTDHIYTAYIANEYPANWLDKSDNTFPKIKSLRKLRQLESFQNLSMSHQKLMYGTAKPKYHIMLRKS